MFDLEKIKTQLKSEFIAIDYVIDQIIDSIKVWVESDKISTPNVICLWGMTGCGKTKLVTRLIELINMREESYYLNMTNQETAQESLKEIMDGDCYYNGNPKNIFILDEFQNCNTINEEGSKIDRKELAIIWELLDSGKFTNKRFPVSTWSIGDVMKDLETIKKFDLFEMTIEESYSDKNYIKNSFTMSQEKKEDINFSFCYIDNFQNYFHALRDSGVSIKLENYEELTLKFKNMKLKELDSFYRSIVNKYVLVEYDYSKSLIFVLGNLDGLYTIADQMESELDADFLHEKSKHLTFQDAKKVLTSLYKPEQISRLGNNHILYNAFSKKNYYDLIIHYLKDINDRFEINLRYDKTVIDMIYIEGVFPTQGVRPLISTLKYTIENNIFEFLRHGNSNSTIRYKKGKLLIDNNNKINLKLNNSNNKLDKTTTDYKRTCVHESGHAFVYYKLFNKYPKNIVIKRNSGVPSGFAEFEYPHFQTNEDIINQMSVLLGGLVAEEIVYNNRSTGIENDLERATSLANNYYMRSAMGKTLSISKHHDIQGSNFQIKEYKDEVEDLMLKSYNIVLETIKSDINNFKMFVKKLYNKGRMSEKDFSKLFPKRKNKESTKFEEFLES